MKVCEGTRVCKYCLVEKPIDAFGLINPSKHKRRICRSCEFKKRKSNNPETYRDKVLSQAKWHAENRTKSHKRASVLRGDMRAMDAKKGWANLTLLSNGLNNKFQNHVHIVSSA